MEAIETQDGARVAIDTWNKGDGDVWICVTSAFGSFSFVMTREEAQTAGKVILGIASASMDVEGVPV